MEEKKEKNNNNSKQILLSVLGVAILIVAVVGISFAVFSYSKAGETTNTISTGTITMSYNEPQNGINITNAVPMTEDQGKVLTGENNTFDFTVTCTITGYTTVNYEVVAVKQDTSNIDDQYIRLYLEESDDNTTYTQVAAPAAYTASTEADDYGAPVGSMKLATGSFTADASNAKSGVLQTKYYRLRMWVDSAFTIDGDAHTYQVKVNVYGKGTN